MKKFICLLLCLIFLFSFGGCGLFGSKEPVEEPDPEPTLEPGQTMFQNPLTGLYDMENAYTGKPYAVSVNNIHQSWPQSGTSMADIIVEIETEGGISRLMCLYTDVHKAANGIGSLRSLRTQFIDGVAQWDPIIVHIGLSNNAEDWLAKYGMKTWNADGNAKLTYKDKERQKNYASEHCWFTTADMLDAYLQTQTAISPTWNPKSKTAFNFADADNPVIPSSGDATAVTYKFSKAYDGDFRYDAATGKYLKFQQGDPQVDAGNNNQQLAFDNVIVLCASIRDIYGTVYDGLISLEYNKGGTGYYFNNGKYEEITWSKSAYNADFVFTKADGTTLQINPGVTHLGIIRNDFESSINITGSSASESTGA